MTDEAPDNPPAELTVDLDPEDFLWYGDPSLDIVMGCFAFGTGIGEPMLARVGRQLAEDVAAMMRLHTAFVTVPQMLTVATEEGQGDASRIRSAFAVFYSLPETRLVRDAARRIGARLAVTGRLVGEGQEIHLGMNVIDVERVLVLGCSQATAPRESLVDTVIDGVARLLSHFCDTPREALTEQAAAILGTRSYHAYFNWALGADLERTAAASGRRLDIRRLVQRLGWSLRHDALFTRPLERLIEIVFSTHDEIVLQEIAKFMADVPLRMPGPALVRAEALQRLGEVNEARKVLEDVVEVFAHCAQAHYLLGELEADQRPTVAAEHFRQAHIIEPRNPRYARRVQGDT